MSDFFNAIIAKGGEGVILRDSQISFKLKAQNDAECKIIDYTRGKGRLSGKIGAIICESLAHICGVNMYRKFSCKDCIYQSHSLAKP